MKQGNSRKAAVLNVIMSTNDSKLSSYCSTLRLFQNWSCIRTQNACTAGACAHSCASLHAYAQPVVDSDHLLTALQVSLSAKCGICSI